MIKITSAFTICVLVVLLFTVCIGLKIAVKRGRLPAHAKKAAIAANTGLALLVICGIALFALYQTGASRGMTFDNWKQMTVPQIIETNSNTPKTQSLPDKKNGTIVILYKYGCEDCEAIYSKLEKTLDELEAKDVYYIASSTPDGKKMVEDGNIEFVPTAVYLRHEPLANGAAMNHVAIAYTNGNDTELDTAALRRIVLLQGKQK